MSELSISRMSPDDFLTIARQPSQRVCLQGYEPGQEEAEHLAAQDEAWSAWGQARDGTARLLAVMGIVETFEALTGLVWAVLAEDVGAAHLPISRFAKSRIVASALPRIEALARAGPVLTLAAAMADPTPECRWPVLLGLTPAYLLRRYGPTSENYILFERIEGGS